MTITIKDVAKAAGVSPSTVSKVIHNDSSISAATRTRVQRVIKESGYQPNIQARNFVQQKTCHIIFLTRREEHAAFTNPHMFEIMSGIEANLSAHGYSLEFKTVPTDEETSDLVRAIIAQKRADAVIIHGSIATKELTELLIQNSYPYIIIGKPDFITQVNWIDTNNFLSGQLCGEYLLSQGYTDIAFLGGLRSDNIFKQRLYGFLQIMRNAGIEIPEEYIKYGRPDKEGGFRLTSELLSLPDRRPQVVVCTNNFVAFGALKAITSHQLRIPEDIQYVCFDKYPVAYIMEPRPVMIDIDVYDLGTQAAALLLQRIKNPFLQVQTHSAIPSIIADNG